MGTGKKKYCVRPLIDEMTRIKIDMNLNSDAEAQHQIVRFSQIGRNAHVPDVGRIVPKRKQRDNDILGAY